MIFWYSQQGVRMFLIYAWLSLWLHFFVHNSESLEAEKYMMSTCPPINEIKVAFVTAITGFAERSCKEPEIQSVPADFIAYTDKVFDDAAAHNREQIYNRWRRVDIDRYRYGISEQDNSTIYYNSYSNNQNSFNRAKFVKMNLHRLPELRGYHILIWVDGTVKIHNEKTVEILYDSICRKGHNILVFEHSAKHDLAEEVQSAKMSSKYTSVSLNNEAQPPQFVDRQYATYLREGFNDSFFGRSTDRSGQNRYRSVFVTNFVAFNMLRKESHVVLEKWWLQNLMYSTEDQVGFPYALWKLRILPYTLPDNDIKGSFTYNTLFKSMQHAKRPR